MSEMSEMIDSKVVEMRFDNAQFEENVQTTMGSLEKLKQSLKFEKTSKGFESIEKAARDTDISSLSKAAETVSVKFDAMQVAAVTAITNVVNTAMNAGERLIKSLSVDNIADGWKKFADKTTSVGTLVAQGFDIGTVTKQLERLNWYTDETSYNFTDMVSNISKFTATGKGLKDSVTAMEGIANWAALSGQSAATASRAMYQLSQAMGAGVMRLEDYKSIQNVSMDTDEFRQKALDAAVALGTLQKNANGTYTSLMAVDKAGKVAFTKNQFTTNLTQGKWFTSDVMMKVFKDYSTAVDDIYDYAIEKGITASEAIEELGDKVDSFGLKAFRAAQEARTWTDVIASVKDAVSTGWMNTFENIFGNYEEAKELWTDLANELYDVFAEGGNARNELLAEWKRLGGRNVLVESFWDVYHSLRAIADTVKDAFHDVFPEITVKRIVEVTKNIRRMTVQIMPSEGLLTNIRSVLDGVFTVIGLILRAVTSVAKGFEPILSYILHIAGESNSAASSIGQLASKLREAADESGIFESVTKRIANVLNTLIGYLDRLIDNNISDYMVGFNRNGRIADGIFTALAGNIGNTIKMIFDLLSAVSGRDLSSVRDNILYTFASIEKAASVAFAVISAVISGIRKAFLYIVPVVSFIFNSIVSWAKKVYDFITSLNFSEIFGSIDIGGFFNNIVNKISDGFTSVKKIFSSGEEVLEDAEEKTESMTGIAGKIMSLFEPMLKALKNVFYKIGKGQDNKIDISKIIDIAAVGGLIAAAKMYIDGIKLIVNTAKDIATGKALRKALGIDDIIQCILDIGEGVQDVLKEYRTKIKVETFQNIATSIFMIAMSMYVVSTIPVENLARSLIGVGAAFTAMLVLFKQLTGFAIKVGKFGNKRKIEQLAGLVSSSGLSMLEIGGGLLLVSMAVAKMALLDPDELTNGVKGMVECLAAMLIAVEVIGLAGRNLRGIRNAENVVRASASMVIMAAAVNMLVPVIASFAAIDKFSDGRLPDYIWTVASMIITMTLAIEAMSKFGKGWKGIRDARPIVAATSSMAIMAAAVNMLIPAIMTMAIIDAVDPGRATDYIWTIASLIVVMTIAIEAMGKFGSGWKGIDNAKQIVAATSSMAIMAAAVNMLIPAIASFAAIDAIKPGGLAASVAAFIFIMLTLVGAVEVLGHVRGGFTTREAANIAILGASMALIGKGIGEIAKTMLAFAAAIGGLKAIGFSNFGAWSAVVLGIITMVAGIGIAMNNIPAGIFTSSIRAALAFGIVASSLNMLIPVLTAMTILNTTYDLKNIWMGIAELTVVMTMMAGLLAAMSALDGVKGGTPLQLIFGQFNYTNAGNGIRAMSLALLAISSVIKTLSKLNQDSAGRMGAWVAIGQVTAVILTFVGALGLLSKVNGMNLFIVSKGILSTSVAFLAFSTAMAVFAPAATALAASIGVIMGGVLSGIKIIADNSQTLTDALRTILESASELIIDVFGALLLGILNAFDNYIPPLTEVILHFATELIKVIDAQAIPLGEAIVYMFMDILVSIEKVLGPLLQAIVDFVIIFMDTLADTIAKPENAERLRESCVKLYQNTVQAFFELFGADVETAMEIAETAVEGLQLMFDQFEGFGEWIYDITPHYSNDQSPQRTPMNWAGKQGEPTVNIPVVTLKPNEIKMDTIPEDFIGPSKGIKIVSNPIYDIDTTGMPNGIYDISELKEHAAYVNDEITAGYVSEARSNEQAMYDANYSMGAASMEGLQDSTGVHSESRIAHWIGGNVAAGLGSGLLEKAEYIKELASKFGTNTIDALDESLTSPESKKQVSESSEELADTAVDGISKAAENKENQNKFTNALSKLWNNVKAVFGGSFGLDSFGMDMSGLSFFNDTDDTYVSLKDYMRRFAEIQNELDEFTDLPPERVMAHAEKISELKNEYDELYKSFSESTVIPAILAEADENVRKLTDRIEILEKRGKNVTTAEKARLDQLKSELSEAVSARDSIWTKLLGGDWKGIVPEEAGEEDGNSYVDGVITALDNGNSKSKKASEKFWASFKLPDGSIFNYEFSSYDDYVKKGQSIGGFDNVAKAAFEHKNDEDQRSAFQSWDDDILEAQLTAAKEAYDKFFDDFEKGTISASEYEKRFTALLKKNTPVQAALMEYAADKMKGHTKDALENITDEYEKKLSEIQDKIDSFVDNIGLSWSDFFDFVDLNAYADNILGTMSGFFEGIIGNTESWAENFKISLGSVMSTDSLGFEDAVSVAVNSMNTASENAASFSESMRKSLSEAFTFKTNADHIEELNEKLEQTKELYGEDSNQARLLEQQIKNFTKNTKGKENEIYSVNETAAGEKKKPFGDSINQETEMLKKYAGIIENLKQRGISKDIIQMLSGMGREEGMAAAEYLSKLSDEAYQKFLDDWDEHKLAGDDLGHLLYEGTEDSIEDIIDSDSIAIAEYFDELNTLLSNKNRAVSSSLISMLKNMGRDDAAAAMSYLNGLTDTQYNEVLKKLDANEQYTIKAQSKLYKAEIAAFSEYSDQLDLLMARPVSAGIIDMIKGMGNEEAVQAMKYLNSLSDTEYEKFSKLLKMNEKASDKVTEKMYEADAKTLKERLKAESKELSEYNIELGKLVERGITAEAADMIAGMSRQEGLATIKYLNNLSETEYKELMDIWAKNRKASEKAAQTAYNASSGGSAARFKTELSKDYKTLKDYRDSLNELMAKRELPDSLKEYIASLDREEGLALIQFLSKMSEEEYEKTINIWKKKENIEQDIGSTLYGEDIKDATTEYVNGVGEILNKLPESAKEAGKKAARAVADGMSEEAKTALNSIEVTVTDIYNRIVNTFDRIATTLSNMAAKERPELEHLAQTFLNTTNGKSVSGRTKSNIVNNGVRASVSVRASASSETKGISPVSDSHTKRANAFIFDKYRRKWVKNPEVLPAPDTTSGLARNVDNANRAVDSNVAGSLARIEAAVSNAVTIMTRGEAVISALPENMDSGFNMLGDSFNNAQVVIDAAAVTSKLASPMANAIGRLSVAKRRGV